MTTTKPAHTDHAPDYTPAQSGNRRRSNRPGWDRRRARRLTSPMTVVIGVTPYATQDWSLAGARIADYFGSLKPHAETALRVLVPTAGPGALFHAQARIERYDPGAPSLAVGFEALDSIASQTLNRYFLDSVAREQA